MLLHAYILLAIALVLMSLALRLFLKYQRTPSIAYFATMFLGLAALAIITTIVITSQNDGTVLLATRLGYFAGVLVFSMMLMFSWYYPAPSKNIPRHQELFWIVPLVFFLPFILMSSMAVQGIERVNSVVREVAGPGFFVFPLFVLIFIAWSLGNLVTKLRTTQVDQQRNVRLVILGFTLGAGASLLFDAILPLFGHPPRHYVSVELSSVLIGVTAYIVTRK